MKLYYKFVLSYIIFGVAAFAVIATLSTSLTHRYLIQSQSKTLYDEANLIAGNFSDNSEGSTSLETIEPQIKVIGAYLHSQIWVMDKNGTVLADSQGVMSGTNVPAFDPTAGGTKNYMDGDFFGCFDEEVISVCVPITGNYKTLGYVVIHLPMSELTENENQILNIVYITSIIVFLLSLILLIVFDAVIYRPLRRITEGASEFAGGNLKHQISVKSHDEMGYLANTMNLMARDLDEAEGYQHSFIANISHDFRSPLTSIKGYLEAILDGTIPPEKQEQYLSRVIGEVDRLTKLTSSMLTLNTIDSKGLLNRTKFDINRMIKETAQSFEGQCLEKSITFELTFEEESQMVYADFSKIQQVIYNLVDNAIKFSGKDSSIYLSTVQKGEKILTSVKDTGEGIPKKDLKHIFDRFYKSDTSRGKDKKGTGLGLAIVKGIIQSHGENIDVISTEGVGTEFVFSLPNADELEGE
ncbi:MAG: HAMP domain-containing sensor histidine kinase [Lachnospiraceae bacterium]|nr:HAMP domain-containing sensor histidine kinase [Lachnospiraceae bacterium]